MSAPDLSYMPAAYWKGRAHFRYYARVRSFLESLGPRGSLIDVGCWDTPVATWGTFTRRYALDLVPTPPLPGVEAVVANYLTWTPPEALDVATCLQTLEHMDLRAARAFGRKLRADARLVVVTVPYRWPAGQELSHRLDPIDGNVLADIMGGPAGVLEVIAEGKRARLFAVYGEADDAT